ncbi:MAG TPA: hypothetical protein PK843_13700, partial [bacterium]|nr:hypothetical protein [bacterium]
MKLYRLKALALFVLAFQAMAFAGTTGHFTWYDTDNNMTIAMTTSTNKTLGGAPLQNGDEVGFFNGSGVCVGGLVWNGSNTAGPAMGVDDFGNPGLTAGEVVQYRLYRPSLNREFTSVSVSYLSGTGAYVPGATRILSVFNASAYTLTMAVSPSGSGTTTPAVGSYLYNPNQVVNVTATASGGNSFLNWTGDVADVNDPTTTVTMNSDKTVTANFGTPQYTLTMAVSPGGSGTTTPAVGGHSYASGESVPITATAATGYHFVNWTVSGGAAVANPTSASTTVSVDQNKTVTANFAQNTYSLTINTVGSGSVTKDPDQTSYAHGAVVTLTANPAAGWTFSGWSGALTGSTNPTTITMDAAKSVTATFTQITYTLTMAVSPGGSGTTTPAVG